MKAMKGKAKSNSCKRDFSKIIKRVVRSAHLLKKTDEQIFLYKKILENLQKNALIISDKCDKVTLFDN